MTVTRISVPAATHAPTGTTNAYVLDLADSLLVDPAAWTDDLAETAREASVAHIAVTHHHPDHVEGVAAASRALGATVWARAGREASFEAATGVSPDRVFAPGDSIPADTDVTVLDTPGHTPEHVAFATGDGFLSGDLAVAEGSVVVGAPEGDMRAYLTSLRRVFARAPAKLFPGHGQVIETPRQTCRRLIEHRLTRERRIKAAVADGVETLATLVDTVYEKDVSGVRSLAEATVVAHLEKLAVENRVRWDGDRARPA